jgi:diguanylate cyclase (GGDEF)-like protein/PAS domain S-box-containing protein
LHEQDGAMPLTSARFLLPPRTQWIATTAVLAVFGLLLTIFVWHERMQTVERERDRLLTQIRVIDANLRLELQGANAAISSLRPTTAISAQDTQRNQERSATLKVLSDALPAVRTMLTIDAQGTVVSSSRPDAIRFDASQRAYFLSAKHQPRADTLYVGAPFTTERNIYALTLVKAWTGDANEFNGITMAALDPEYFTVLLRSVLYADDMRITLVHGDGLAFLTVPNSPEVQGTNLNRPGTVFVQHMASGQTESLHIGSALLHGGERMVAFRTVRPSDLNMDKPLLLAVSRDLHAVLAPWHQLALAMAFAYALVCTLTFVGLYFLRRKQTALLELSKARRQDAREQAERLELALSGGDLGLFDLDMQTGIRYVDARAREIVGDGPDDPVDSFAAWAQRRHPDDVERTRAALQAHTLGHADAFTADYRVRHKDGHWVWVHSRARITQRSADGQALRMVGTYQDISDRKTAEARIAEFAFYDPLTQLPNRRLLMDRLSQSQVASARSRKHGAVLYMDLDHFKSVNDTLGHDMGDLLLQQVAVRVQSCVRQSDTVARLGGDEFVVVLDQLSDSLQEAQAHARRMADKILDALREPVQLGAQGLNVTSSVGISLFLGETASAAQLLKQADQALYHAKGLGRNQAVVFTLAIGGQESDH